MGSAPNGNGSLEKRLFQIAEHAEDGARWRELALSLKGKKGDERHQAFVRVAKAMRDGGALDDYEAHYFVSRAILMIAEERIFKPGNENPALDVLGKTMDAVQRKHGLTEDEFWPKGEAPEEYQRLSDEWNRVTEEILAAAFEEYGEPELGAMYRHDRKRFDQLEEEGRRKFFASKKPTN